MTQLIQQHPQTPYIQLQALRLVGEYLRREILPRPTYGSPPFSLLYPTRKPKVRQLRLILSVKQYILRLQVPVQYILPVQLLYRLAYVPENERYLTITQPTPPPRIVEQTPLRRVLYQQVDEVPLPEHLIQLDYVPVPQSPLYRDLLLNIPQFFRF